MKIAFSILFFILSFIYTIIGLIDFQLFVGTRPGPGFFPVLVGGLMTILTGINALKDIKNRKKETKLTSLIGEQLEEVSKSSEVQLFQEKEEPTYLKDVFIVVVLISGFIFMLPILGGLLAMFSFMMVSLFYLNKGRLLQNVLCSITIPIGLFLLFDVWLQAGLPQGIFGF